MRSDELGILVIGYNRPYHLQAVLESLRLQNKLTNCHVWIDGTQGLGEFAGIPDQSIKIARRYKVKEIRTPWGHFGIDKHILTALTVMSEMYTRVLILEDDCFPVEGAIEAFDEELVAVAAREDVYSVYGHHFLFEPEETLDFTRFQGWGWGANSHQLEKIIPELKKIFLLDEESYKSYARDNLTDDVRRVLDVTPGRDVIRTLELGYSWDAVTALITAKVGLAHRRTKERQIFNIGITEKIGHFQRDSARLRNPPFNMITLSEAWRHYDRTTKACDFSQESYGLERLDLKIIENIPVKDGFFVEIGAHDGVTQSNSVLLEKDGWRGLLIEANPGSFAKCCRARPHVLVEHAACVSSDFSGSHTTLVDVGLMSMTGNSSMTGEQRDIWLARGEGFAQRDRQEIEVPAAQISRIFDKYEISKIDLLLLDVEGAERDVLSGLDFSRHAPTWIVAEDLYDDAAHDFLISHGYELIKILSERRYTRDRLYFFEERREIK